MCADDKKSKLSQELTLSKHRSKTKGGAFQWALYWLDPLSPGESPLPKSEKMGNHYYDVTTLVDQWCLGSSNIRIIWIILYKSIVWHCYISIYIYINLYKDRYVWHYLFIQWKWSKLSKEKLSFFSVLFLHINICCHKYISLYRFLYIYWYITKSNYASTKNN